MKICIFLWALLSAAMSAPAESDRLPQFLQALPFFSELQSLQQTFQDLQANIPAEVMTQLQQSLPPFLVNILAGGQQPAGRTLQDLQSQLPQLIQTLTQLQSSLPPEVLAQLQQSLPPFLASLLQQQPAAGRTLQDVAQQLQQSLPPFLANLLSSQLTNDGSSPLLQQLQTVLPPEVFQQLQQIIANLQPAAGRAGETAETELTEDQKIKIEDFVKRCQSLASGYGGYGYRYPSSGYPSSSYYPSYSTGTSYPYYNGYNTGYNSGYPTPTIAIQPSYQRYPGSTGTLYGTNGGYIATGRSDLERKDNDDIETKHKHGGGGGKHGWWNSFNNNNYQKPSYGNYQKPSYGNYQKPNYENYQNAYNNPYMYYNPYSAYQYPNYNIGTIGNNGVVVPGATGTTGTTGTSGTNTGTVTAIREHRKKNRA